MCLSCQIYCSSCHPPSQLPQNIDSAPFYVLTKGAKNLLNPCLHGITPSPTKSWVRFDRLVRMSSEHCGILGPVLLCNHLHVFFFIKKDVHRSSLRAPTSCHFFCGVGGGANFVSKFGLFEGFHQARLKCFPKSVRVFPFFFSR